MRSAVVTGAAHGIGAATVRRLVQRGFDVLACDIEATPGPQPAPASSGAGTAIPFTADVASDDVADRIADEVRTRFGRLDVLVNNAGLGHEQHFAETSRADWERVLGVGLTAPFLLTQALWPYLRKPGGAVVNVSSVHGQRPLPGLAAYAAAKGGLENLTRALALDAAPGGVRVNAVAPGFTRTRRWDDWMGGAGERADWNRREVDRLIPWNAPAEADDVASVIVWLAAADEVAVTGAVVPVDGGLAAQAYTRLEYDDVHVAQKGEVPR